MSSKYVYKFFSPKNYISHWGNDMQQKLKYYVNLLLFYLKFMLRIT